MEGVRKFATEICVLQALFNSFFFLSKLCKTKKNAVSGMSPEQLLLFKIFM
jgi:hypothetical protein